MRLNDITFKPSVAEQISKLQHPEKTVKFGSTSDGGRAIIICTSDPKPLPANLKFGSSFSTSLYKAYLGIKNIF